MSCTHKSLKLRMQQVFSLKLSKILMFTCKRIPPQTPPQAKLMRQSSRGNFLRRTSTALARGCVCAFKNWELRISWHKLDKVVLFFFVGAYDWFLKRSNSFLCYGLSLRCLYFVGTLPACTYVVHILEGNGYITGGGPEGSNVLITWKYVLAYVIILLFSHRNSVRWAFKLQ